MNGGVQTLVDGAQWTVTGDNPDIINDPDQNPPGDGTNEVGVTDPLGKQILLNFTKTSPYTLTDANGAVTQYRYEGAVSFDYTGAYYHDGTLLMQAILPEGIVYAAQYNGPFRAVTQETMTPKPGSDLQVITKTYGYASTASLQSRAKPIIVTDPKGNVSNYTYATHGGVLSELRPLATLADASGSVQARPLKLTTWAQRYAWIKNSVGALVQAATPVWVTATESQCQAVPGSNTPTCDAGKQQTLTTYQYGATGTGESLLVKGVAVSSGGVTLRTCYTYDALARKVSETKPNANLEVCP